MAKKNSEKMKNMKNEKIKKILSIILPIIVSFLCAIFILSGGLMLAMRDHEPIWIITCYILYLLLEFVVVYMFMQEPNYNLKSGGKSPKYFVHSAITMFLSLFLGIITRLIWNVIFIKFVVVGLNVFLLEIIFFIWEKDPFTTWKGKAESEVQKEILKKFMYVYIEMFITYLLVEAQFSYELFTDFEKFIRNG